MRKRIALGGAIKAIREAQKRPGSRLASDCLMSHAHLCNIEAGRKLPPPEVIERIATALDVPIDAISYEVTTEAAA
jgi:transcriptional regulator with XRE-family HTH domain